MTDLNPLRKGKGKELIHPILRESIIMASKTPDMQLLGDTLTRQYRLACELYNTYPTGRFTHQFSQGTLTITLSTVDHDHLEALCHALQNRVTPLILKMEIPRSKEGEFYYYRLRDHL
ncbi:hypothetical protein SK128_013758 [Halocaridina rubra]|uniref:Uncharacterized protein n=1 Tax=Halocaridina rubra TaxID=373956 RepID=A0AAN9A5Y3_HALRR